MKNFIFYITILVCFLSLTSIAKATDANIAAVVNDSIITITDVKNRVKLYDPSININENSTRVKLIKNRVLNKLIDETIELQEAQKLGVSISKEEISVGVDKIAKQNKVSPEKLKNDLKSKGIDVNSLYDQIKAEMAWSQVIRRKLSPKINISDRDIDAAIEKIKKESKKTQYFVSEIFLNVANFSQDREVREKMNNLLEKIKDGESFPLVAKDFSQSPNASNGGDLGWVKEGQLATELNNALKKMKSGQVSPPIRSDKGYYLLFLKDIRKKKNIDFIKNNKEIRKKITNQLGMQRLIQRAEHYMKDLHSTSFIEKRI